MPTNDQGFLWRKERIGTIALISWFALLIYRSMDPQLPLLLFPVWIFSALFVYMDSRSRGTRVFWWTAYALVVPLVTALAYFSMNRCDMMPLAILHAFIVGVYLALRPSVQPRCYRCGSGLGSQTEVCPICGYQNYLGRLESMARRIYGGLADSVTSAPTAKGRDTAKSIAIACAAFGVFGLIFHRLVPSVLAGISLAGYWVLLAWWVYLDSAWRRMYPFPWAVLTLVTNLFGLATYLVVRNPDPKTCSQCGSVLSIGLKWCPYCGTETEIVCPVCQSAVNADWVYCPACSTELPGRKGPSSGDEEKACSTVIRGTVVDGKSARPISDALVKVDSKSLSVSATTDAMGRFALTGLEVRPYVLVASAEGFTARAESYSPSAVGSKSISFVLFPEDR